MNNNLSSLTIVLTLKGRDLFTLRWLWHANKFHIPFKILIADGEVNPLIRALLVQGNLFPNLQIEYREYSDFTYNDFYKK